MPRDLHYFMRERTNEIVSVPGPESFVDENGQRVMLEIRVLGGEEIQNIHAAYRRRAIALDKSGAPYIFGGEVVYQTENDADRAVAHTVAEALVYPDLKDEKLMAFYKCSDISQMLQRVFWRADESKYVIRAVFAALGLSGGASGEETLASAKN